MDTLDTWLTIDELAGYIKMSRTKLYGMAQRGDPRFEDRQSVALRPGGDRSVDEGARDGKGGVRG